MYTHMPMGAQKLYGTTRYATHNPLSCELFICFRLSSRVYSVLRSGAHATIYNKERTLRCGTSKSIRIPVTTGAWHSARSRAPPTRPGARLIRRRNTAVRASSSSSQRVCAICVQTANAASRQPTAASSCTRRLHRSDPSTKCTPRQLTLRPRPISHQRALAV